jgi:hypothetical protein
MLGFSNRTSAMSLMSGGGSSTREAARTWVPVAAARVVPLRGVPVRGLLVPTFRGATVAALAGIESTLTTGSSAGGEPQRLQ